jgi:hypothetical protein
MVEFPDISLSRVIRSRKRAISGKRSWVFEGKQAIQFRNIFPISLKDALQSQPVGA